MEEREKPTVDVYLDDEVWGKKIEEFLKDVYALAARTDDIHQELRRLRASVLIGALVGAFVIAGAIVAAAVFL